VIIATDVFGYKFNNTRLLADEFASSGFLCVVPDLFNGESVPISFLTDLENAEKSTGFFSSLSSIATLAFGLVTDMVPFFIKHPFDDKIPILNNVIKHLKMDYGITNIGIQGYCYGGKLCVKMGAIKESIDAIVCVHPSSLTIPGDIEQTVKPALFLCAEKDNFLSLEQVKEIEAIWKKKESVPFKLKIYPGTTHGFALRGDHSDPHIAAAVKDALSQSVEWYKTYLR